MNFKFVFIIFILFVGSKVNAQSDSLLCEKDSLTFALNKVWEFDDGYIMACTDTFRLENLLFFKINNNEALEKVSYFSEDKDGNTYVLSKDKKKKFLIIPKNEIFDYKVDFEGRYFIIKSYHASIKTPYCIYDDLIMLEGKSGTDFYKKQIGLILNERDGIKSYLSRVYYKKPEIAKKE